MGTAKGPDILWETRGLSSSHALITGQKTSPQTRTRMRELMRALIGISLICGLLGAVSRALAQRPDGGPPPGGAGPPPPPPDQPQ
jgi:hypothetical protein